MFEAEGSTMRQQWEYLQITISDDIDKVANRLGLDGWELLSWDQLEPTTSLSNPILLVFKRPIEETHFAAIHGVGCRCELCNRGITGPAIAESPKPTYEKRDDD